MSAFYLYLVLCSPSECLDRRVNVRFTEKECKLAMLYALRTVPRPQHAYCIRGE
jgi:hypothetical protein